MTLTIAIDAHKPIHYAHSAKGGLCAFTANRLGYQTLLKWSSEVAQGEGLLFILAQAGGFAGPLIRWLREREQRVKVSPVWVVG